MSQFQGVQRDTLGSPVRIFITSTSTSTSTKEYGLDFSEGNQSIERGKRRHAMNREALVRFPAGNTL